MSDTPRSDEMMAKARSVSWQASYGLAVELARELERENAKLRNALVSARGGLCAAAIKDGTLDMVNDALGYGSRWFNQTPT